MEARESALAARTRELHQREQSLAEREQKAQAVRAGSNLFAAAFRGGEVRKVGPSPKAPDRLTWWASRDVTEARREELRAAWRLTARPVREALAEVSSATLAVEARKQALQEPEAILQAAKAEVIAGLRDDFDTLKKAWAQNEATYNVSTKGNWRWWLADGLTASRRTRLEACVQSVGGLVGWMARRFEETVNEVVRYLSPSAQAEFRSEWVDALDRDAAPQWDASGDGPSGVTGGTVQSGPSLGI